MHFFRQPPAFVGHLALRCLMVWTILPEARSAWLAPVGATAGVGLVLGYRSPSASCLRRAKAGDGTARGKVVVPMRRQNVVRPKRKEEEESSEPKTWASQVGAVAKEPAEKEVPTAKGDNQVSQSEVGAVAKEPQVPQAKGRENETPQQESGTVGKDAGGVVTPAKSETVKAEDSDEIGEPVAEYPAYYYPSEWEYGREWEAEREFWEDLDAPYEVFEGPQPEEVEEVGVVVPELDPEGPPVVAQAATGAAAAKSAAAATAATATTAGTGAPAPVALWRRGRRPGRWGRRPGRWGRPGRRPWGRPIYRPRPYYRPGYCLRWAYYYGGRYCAYWR